MATKTQTAEETLEALQGAEQLQKAVTVRRVQYPVNAAGVPERREVEHTVYIRPLVFSEWARALKHMKALLLSVGDAQVDINNLTSIGFVAMSALADNPDAIIELLTLATRQDRKLFDEIEADDAVRLVTEVVTINKDFFVQRVMPLLSDLQTPETGSDSTTQTE